MQARDYANTRFSGLDEINTGNVKSLRPVWTFSTGTVRGHEAAPLYVNGTRIRRPHRKASLAAMK